LTRVKENLKKKLVKQQQQQLKKLHKDNVTMGLVTKLTKRLSFSLAHGSAHEEIY